VCGVLITLVSACASQPEPTSRRLSGDTFDDVPAPESAVFRTAAGESFAFQSSGFRCGRFVFDYPGADTEAILFFKETMQRPPFSWKLTNEQREVEGSTRLTLVKGGDTCMCSPSASTTASSSNAGSTADAVEAT